MPPLFIDKRAAGPNLAQLAVRDLEAAAAVLSKPQGVVRGLDVRQLAGGERAQAAGPRAFDVYLGCIDAGLARLPGLSTYGYSIVRAAR